MGPAGLDIFYSKIAYEVLSFQAFFILEVYAYLVVAVTCKVRSSHAGLCAYA